MKRNIYIFLVFLFAISCSNKEPDKLTIAAAANMQFVMPELERTFEAQYHSDIEVILGSSGKLTSQIMAGAPYDIFLSADSKYPTRIFQDGLAIEEPEVYAFGRLVIWSSIDSAIIRSNDVDWNNVKVAIANPKTAPYGQAAIQFIQSTPPFKMLEDQLVYGESIAQVNQFLLTGAATIGFTSKSSVISEPFKDKGHWNELPSNTYSALEQSLLILKSNPQKESLAKSFSDFILSPKGQEILNNFGYSSTAN